MQNLEFSQKVSLFCAEQLPVTFKVTQLPLYQTASFPLEGSNPIHKRQNKTEWTHQTDNRNWEENFQPKLHSDLIRDTLPSVAGGLEGDWHDLTLTVQNMSFLCVSLGSVEEWNTQHICPQFVPLQMLQRPEIKWLTLCKTRRLTMSLLVVTARHIKRGKVLTLPICRLWPHSMVIAQIERGI